VHPQWASAQLYPHLIEDRFARVVEPYRPLPGQAPGENPAAATKQDPLAEDSPDAWAGQVMSDLAVLISNLDEVAMKSLFVRPNIRRDILKEAILSLCPGMAPSEVIAIYRRPAPPGRWAGGFILGLHRIAWITRPKKEKPTVLSYESLKSVQFGLKKKSLILNGRKLDCFEGFSDFVEKEELAEFLMRNLTRRMELEALKG
jgi:hypothetical protein